MRLEDKVLLQIAKECDLPANFLYQDLLERVRGLARLGKQAELVELANQAARTPRSAMDLWRELLALADDAGGGCIDAKEWEGICGNIYALLREEQRTGKRT